MARQARIEYPGAAYHVTARGNDRTDVFPTAADRKHYLQLLGESAARHDVVLHAYMLMGDHYHLVLRTPQANLSRFMHDLNTAYAVWVNRQNARTGHLLEGRYRAIVIDEDAYLLAVTAHVHLNPVRVKPWPQRGVEERLERAETDPWSSCGDYTRGERPPSVSCDAVWRLLGATTRHDGRSRYRQLLRDWLAEDRPSPLLGVQKGAYLGGAAFADRMESILRKNDRLSDQVVAYRQWIPRRPMDEVFHIVLEACGVSEDEVLSHHKPNLARDMVMYLCREAAGRELREIGLVLGVKPAAVSLAVKRAGQRVRQDAALGEQVMAARSQMAKRLED